MDQDLPAVASADYQPTAATRRPAPAILSELVALADVRFNGGRPWDIEVRNDRLYGRILRGWSLGFGEAYVDGDWECERLDELIARLLRATIEAKAVGFARVRTVAEAVRQSIFNLQSSKRAFQVGERHYDVGNDVFERMLDSRMIYSCGYWEHASTLEQAQVDKLEMICRKLRLQPGDTLLDIGCGWGGLARHAAEHYGVSVTGVTVSKEQLALAQVRCAGLPVRLLLQDWREIQGRFDKIVSVGMFEHVGPKNYVAFFDLARRLLEPEGLFLLHTIGLDVAAPQTDPWIDKHIFPNGKLPAAHEIAAALESRLLIEDWHNFGHDYDRTLMAWWDNFDRAWPQLKARYDARFYRTWKYYLLSCAGLFRARKGQLWQLVLSHPDGTRPYRSIRLGSRSDARSAAPIGKPAPLHYG